MTSFWDILALALTVVAPALAAFVAKWLAAKAKVIGLSVSAQQEAELQDLVEAAIHHAEEQGRKALKASGTPMPSGAKLEAAVTFLQTQLAVAGRKVPALYVLTQRVEAAIGGLRKDGGSPVANN